MEESVFGVFATRPEADLARARLVGVGVAPARIAVLDTRGTANSPLPVAREEVRRATRGALEGAAVGVGVGILGMLLAEAPALTVGGLPIEEASKSMLFFVIASVTSFAGAIFGALRGYDRAAKEVARYLAALQAGASVVTVKMPGGTGELAERVLADAGAVRTWRSRIRARAASVPRPRTAELPVWDVAEPADTPPPPPETPSRATLPAPSGNLELPRRSTLPPPGAGRGPTKK